jgi:hypothetical protein
LTQRKTENKTTKNIKSQKLTTGKGFCGKKLKDHFTLEITDFKLALKIFGVEKWGVAKRI